MTIELNHTIVPAHDPKASAQFLAGILGLPVDPPVAHFTPITLANNVTLDYDQHDDFESHHYAFLVSDEEFDAAFARISGAASPSSPTPPASSRARSTVAAAAGAPISATPTAISWRSSPRPPERGYGNERGPTRAPFDSMSDDVPIEKIADLALFKIPSADRCLSLQLAALFSLKPAPSSSGSVLGPSREQPRRVASALPDQLEPAL